MKESIINLVREGKIGKAFTTLIEFLNQSGDIALLAELTLLNARYSNIKRDQNKGLIVFEEAQTQINRITESLIKFLDSTPEKIEKKKELITPNPMYSQFEPIKSKKIEKFLTDLLGESKLEGSIGRWNFFYVGLPMWIFTDDSHDRMRIISPIIKQSEIIQSKSLKAKELHKLLMVNFSFALDAKYTIWQEELWACFVHPMDSLSQDHFNSGVLQVANLVINYGHTYASTNLAFNA